jgi:hypothetical protein
MLDPLTLLDYPETHEADEVFIRVAGSMDAGAKK